MPTVSVLIPAYNAGVLVRRAARSALAAGRSVEVIVVDDGSAERVDLGTIPARLIRQENAGLVGALNTALNVATGDYCIRCDADDWLVAGCVDKLVAALGERTFAYGAVRYWGVRNDVYYPPPFDAAQFYRHNASLYPLLWPRDCGLTFRRVDRKQQGLEDWDFALQLIKADYSGVACPEITVLNYLYRGGSMMQTIKANEARLLRGFRRLWPAVEVETL